MAWRNQGITGSNNIPLGNRRRFGGDSETPNEDDYGSREPQYESNKRGRSPIRGEFTPCYAARQILIIYRTEPGWHQEAQEAQSMGRRVRE